MSWKKAGTAVVIVVGVGSVLGGCDRSGSSGHMMTGGMMGGGMMGQPPSANSSKQLPDRKSKGARLVSRYCGQCHAPPAPSAHSAAEWPRVVERMKGHMTTQGKSVPDPKEMGLIIDYLRDHAQK